MRDHVECTDGGIALEFLPAYAPELNPLEYLWAWLKRHALANFCSETTTELRVGARGKSAQRCCAIIASGWKQAELF